MNAIIPFAYDGGEVRVVMQADAPWFVLADLCRVLEIGNVGNAAARLDDDEKGIRQTDTLGGVQNVTIVSEAGLYRLVLRSDKPQAKPFQKWVTSEVLPSIRRTGAYAVPASPVLALTAPRPNPRLARLFVDPERLDIIPDYSVEEAAPMFGMSRDELTAHLVQRGWLYEVGVYPHRLIGNLTGAGGSEYLAYVISTERDRNGRDRLVVQIRITPRGMSELAGPKV